MSDKIILVCGFGRCGSSLVMQMLYSAGIGMNGTPPYYELEGTRSPEWIANQHGRAIKILEPHRHGWKFNPADYAVIWLDRDYSEMAKSHVKFQTSKRGVGVANQRGSRKHLVKWFKQQRPIATKLCESLGPTLYLRFQDLLSQPNTCAIRLAQHCGIDRDCIEAMASAVFSRTPEARPTLDLELKLEGVRNER